ncbi:MAG: methyltransferase domain-containing protein [Pseudomonadota bacterium]
MSDPGTISYYSDEAQTYAEFVGDEADNAWLMRFIEGLPAGTPVLDFGCGHAWAAAVLRDRGFQVTATDGSPGLAVQAKARYDLDVQVALFDELDAVEAFDGIWASFSLLHDSREAMPLHLARLRRAARANALLFLGLKEGEGRQRDHLGRLYTYFGEAELREYLEAAGWGGISCERRNLPGLAGKKEPALHIFARAV